VEGAISLTPAEKAPGMQEPLSPIEEDLNRLEVAIRQLKTQYDIFFAGAAPREPFVTRKEVDLLIKRIGNTPMQRFSDRYRYNSLSGKYQTYCELWSKTMRMREEGLRRAGRGAAAASPAPAPVNAASEEVLFKSKFRDPTVEDDNFKTFYDRYVEARRSRGNGGAEVPYSTFLKQIALKTDAIKSKSGCDSVAYKIVVKEGTVTLKASPVKEKEK
jgi:hypothetical protein